MIIDIFSSFDPATIDLLFILPSPFFWIAGIIVLTIFLSSFWLTISWLIHVVVHPYVLIVIQVRRTIGHHITGFAATTAALFVVIIVINLIGITPYIFSITRHLFFTLALGLPLWLALILSTWGFTFRGWLAILLPRGAPRWLNPFLVLIETIRITVRPITLSFRLAANIRAGHIVLGLIGIYLAISLFTPSLTILLLLFIQVIYIIFEIGICLIQSYIFTLLLTLYADDFPEW